MPDTPDPEPPTLVTTLSQMPDLLARLLADHRDDGRGHCTGCRTAGYGTPGEHWPCTPARLARAAERMLAARPKAARTAGTAGVAGTAGTAGVVDRR